MAGNHQHSPSVSCSAVKKTYHSGGVDTVALRGVDLEAYPGELLMLVGPSGCGKTTLISVIAGILDSDEGDCTVFGEHYGRMHPAERTVFRGQNVGFVFQSFNLIPTLTARENVAIPLLLQGMPRREAHLRADHSLEKLGLAEKLWVHPRDLSGGQQQRVAIARALVHEPRLVVCDEPTSALDQDTGRLILQLFRDVALASGRTLIIVTHDSRIFPFADRIARMNDGVIEDVVSAPAIEQ